MPVRLVRAILWLLSALAAAMPLLGQLELSSGESRQAQFSLPNQSVLWTFYAQAGENILVRAALVGDDGAKPWAKLYGPGGGLLAENHFNGGDSEALIVHDAPASGVYTIEAFTYDRGDTGAYVLGLALSRSAFVTPDDGGSLASGATVDGSLDRADIDIWTFDASAGEDILIRGAKIGDEGAKPWIRVYNPDGSLAASGHFNGGDEEDVLNYQAEQSGEHRMVVSSWIRGDSGDFRIGLALSHSAYVAPDDGGVLLQSSSVAGHLQRADIDLWTLHAAAGGRIDIRAARVGEDGAKPWVRLYNPDGTLAQSGHFNGGDEVDYIEREATQTGAHLAVVSSWILGDEGNYTIDFDISPPSLPPLVFIPGIGGSRLIGGVHTGAKGNGSYLWPTIRPDKIEALNLRDGVEDVEAVAVARSYSTAEDIVIDARSTDIYGPYLQHLALQGYTLYPLGEDRSRLTGTHMLEQDWAFTPTLFEFPYDWRRPNAEHIATLQSYLSRIRELHGGADVDIVAHSMGGLIVRRYLIEHGDEGIRSVATVGAPVWGAPQAVYRLLTGSFFGPGPASIVDWINEDPLYDSLWSMPAVAELLPSSYYMLNGGALLFSELRWDYDANGRDTEIYDPFQYFDLMERKAAEAGSTFNPILANQAFHTPAQDDWGLGGVGAPVLHIAGHKRLGGILEMTPLSIVARSGAWWATPTPLEPSAEIFEHRRLDVIPGPGDGTVPILSANRWEAYLSPGAHMETVAGGDETGHMELLSENEEVWDLVDSFLSNPSAYSSARPGDGPIAAFANAVAAAERLRIVIKGTSYVEVANEQGQTNAKLTDIAAAKVPGVSIDYGSSYVVVEAVVGESLALTEPDESVEGGLELEVARFDSGGSPLSVIKYRIRDGAPRWRLGLTEIGTPALIVDADEDGEFEEAERVDADFASADGEADVEAPEVIWGVLRKGEAAQLILKAADEIDDDARIYFSRSGEPYQLLDGDFDADPEAGVSLFAFAVDRSQNASPVIQILVEPRLDIEPLAEAGFRLRWKASGTSALEFAPTPDGPWKAREGEIEADSGYSSTIVELPEAPIFFRLRW